MPLVSSAGSQDCLRSLKAKFQLIAHRPACALVHIGHREEGGLFMRLMLQLRQFGPRNAPRLVLARLAISPDIHHGPFLRQGFHHIVPRVEPGHDGIRFWIFPGNQGGKPLSLHLFLDEFLVIDVRLQQPDCLSLAQSGVVLCRRGKLVKDLRGFLSERAVPYIGHGLRFFLAGLSRRRPAGRTRQDKQKK